MMEKHGKSALMEISQVFASLPHVDCQSVFQNFAFYRVVWRSFPQSVISEIHWVWPPSFFSKCLKYYVYFTNGTKNSDKVVRFPHNWFWTGSTKFSQSWTGYLPSAVNVLTNTPKISRNTRGDFSQINFHQNDEKTW